MGFDMITAFGDPFETLLNLQRALEARTASDWLQNQTTSQGPFPPINVFQQGHDILAVIELPGVDKNDLHIVHIDADHIKAECRDGILALSLPRSESDKPRTISVS